MELTQTNRSPNETVSPHLSELQREEILAKEYEQRVREEQNQKLREWHASKLNELKQDSASTEWEDTAHRFFEGATPYFLKQFREKRATFQGKTWADVRRAFEQAQKERLSGKAGQRISRDRDWAPWDITRARTLLQENTSSNSNPGCITVSPALALSQKASVMSTVAQGPQEAAASQAHDLNPLLSPRINKKTVRNTPETKDNDRLSCADSHPRVRKRQLDRESFGPESKRARQEVPSQIILLSPGNTAPASPATTPPPRSLFSISSQSLKRLQPGAWLNDEAINAILLIIRHAPGSSINVIDSVLPTIKPPSFNARKMLIPMHVNRNHWVLAVIDEVRTSVVVYDSLPSLETRNEIRAQMEEVSKKYLKVNLRSVHFTSPLLQDNHADCGVLLLVAAFYISAGLAIPYTVDVPFWREMIATLLCPPASGGTSVRISNDAMALAPSVSAVEDTRDGLLPLSRRWAAAVSERKLQITGLECANVALDILNTLKGGQLSHEAEPHLSSAIVFCKKKIRQKQRMTEELGMAQSVAQEACNV
ncbi:Uu.00g134250.m01.CDS01 [Anthostomella pinea]|uniref:Uu.00g134250.m01.CDS01 n=1 Tax=Anthostomella pinea TaxID=933095 RepID=A0AAI8YIE0_9PEZI|nr:Uu.00g134250.m01.CDS01 [Anthostomella pinea]